MSVDIETFPVPVALISRAGQVMQCNAAFRELVAAHSSQLDLSALFGGEFTSLLHGAASATCVEATLPLLNGTSPRPRFRVTVSAPRDAETWTTLLVDVTEEAEFRQRHRDFARDIELVREIGVSLAACTAIDSVTERICEHVARLTRTRDFYVALHDRESGIVSFPRYLRQGRWMGKTSRPFSNGLTEHVLRTGAPLLMSGDINQKARDLGAESMGPPSRSWVGVPMIVSGETLGMISAQSETQDDRFDRHDVEILEVIAGQAAAAIKHAQLLEAARRAYSDLAEAQARLLESERVRGVTEAVGAMNHEINNPLAAIVGNAQLLQRAMGEPDLAKISGKVDSILEAARRIQEVTGKMSTLIQATSMPYPGSEAPILDLRRSVAEGDTCMLFPAPPATRRSA